MKKNLAFVSVLSAILFLCLPAVAQVDTFGGARTVLLCSPSTLAQSSNTPLTNTTAWADIRGYVGVGQALFSATNTAGTTPKIYAYLEGSNDQTNTWALTNVAVGVSASAVLPNFGLVDSTGTNSLTATNYFFVPGTLTTPTAATAGFANVYVAPAAFSSRATLCTNVDGSVAQLGIPMRQQPAYVRLKTVVTGSNSVFVVVGSIIAKNQYQSW